MLTTQQAADLVGVSRRYIVARIDAGDIPLHLQAGNQRRILQSAVLTWHRQQKCTADGALQNVGCCETVSHTVRLMPCAALGLPEKPMSIYELGPVEEYFNIINEKLQAIDLKRLFRNTLLPLYCQ